MPEPTSSNRLSAIRSALRTKVRAIGKTRLAVVGLTAFVVLGGGVVLASNASSDSASSKQPVDMIVMTPDDAMAMERSETASSDTTDAMTMESQPDAMMQQTPVSESAMPAPAMTPAQPAPAAPTTVAGSFSDYDPAKLSNADRGQVVLFFSASWCPTCQLANKNFNVSKAPEGLTLLKVNYDDSTDLKRKYGVTYQHTFVQVDKNGNQIKKWSSSNTYDAIKAQLN